MADTTTSENDFVKSWAKTVNTKFSNIPEADILGLYDRATDKHNSNIRVREFWKYGMALGVSGTPTVFVNGVKVVDAPTTLETWTAFIEAMYA